MVPSLELLGTTTIDVFAENLIAHNLYSVTFDWATGQGEPQKENVRIYPNPTSGNVYLYGADHASISVYNSIGSLVFITHDFSGHTLSFSSLPKGVYLMKIEKADHSVIQKKVVVI